MGLNEAKLALQKSVGLVSPRRPSSLKRLSLDAFRKEIQRLKEAEKKKGETVHLQGWDPNLLQEKDRRIYKKYKEGALTLEEFKNYQKEFQHREADNRDREFESRRGFCEYLAKELTGQIHKKYLK